MKGYEYEGFPDIGYGKTETNSRGRPSIAYPNLVVEVKSFEGFTRPQQAIRKGRLRDDDMRKLRALPKEITKASVIFDTGNFLDKEFAESLEELMKQDSIQMFVVQELESRSTLTYV